MRNRNPLGLGCAVDPLEQLQARKPQPVRQGYLSLTMPARPNVGEYIEFDWVFHTSIASNDVGEFRKALDLVVRRDARVVLQRLAVEPNRDSADSVGACDIRFQ